GVHEQRPAREDVVSRDPRREGQRRRGAGEAAREEVRRDLRLPDRLLDDRAAVVRDGLGHPRPPTKAAATPATTAAPATNAAPHISPRSRVGTTGSGGRPYTSGSSSRRKKAPAPPTPSSPSARYSRASSIPTSCSSSTRP